MTEKIDSIVQAARDLADKAQQRAGDGAEAVRDALGRVADLGQLGSEATQGITDDLNELLPAIRRAGYHVRGIDLDGRGRPRGAARVAGGPAHRGCGDPRALPGGRPPEEPGGRQPDAVRRHPRAGGEPGG